MEDIFSDRIDLEGAYHVDVLADDPAGDGADQLSPEDTAHLIAAMARLAAQGDHAGVAKLAQLAKEPEKLHEIVSDTEIPPMTEEDYDALMNIIVSPEFDDDFKDMVYRFYFPNEQKPTPERRQQLLAEMKNLSGGQP